MLRGQIDDLVETRLAIELETVRLATERASQNSRSELHQLAYELEVSMEIETFIERDLRFHLTLAKASQNIVMHRVVYGIQQLMRKSMLQVLQRENMRGIAVMQHRAIAEAIYNGDVETAVQVMQEHLMKDVKFFNEQDGP